jgi:hypothetical protein
MIMRYFCGFLGGVALSMVSLIGCSDESGTAGSGGTGGTGGVDTVARIIVIRGWSPRTGFMEVLEGVEICETDTDHCVLTDAAGRATVRVPVDQEFSFTLEKEGYTPSLLADLMPPGPEIFTLFGMPTDERMAHQYELVMSPYPMEGTGSIVIITEPRFSTNLICVGVAGVTFDLGYAAGKVYYYDEQGNWDADLSATSCFGFGGFTEVPPGEVQIEIGGNAENCVVRSGWPGELENSVRTPIRAGHQTWLHVSCDVPE